MSCPHLGQEDAVDPALLYGHPAQGALTQVQPKHINVCHLVMFHASLLSRKELGSSTEVMEPPPPPTWQELKFPSGNTWLKIPLMKS